MRKYNSSIKTAFISEAGSQLRNNDYFGFVELDKYACYVIADGITQMRDSASAREAIETIIDAFQSEPGISRKQIKRYLKTANSALLQGKSYEKLKASVTVIVTDYQKLRYGHAGNTRLRLYRGGREILATADMSLSQELVDAEALTEDKLAAHEERNNLLSYLGQERFCPFISKKIKLANEDIITLYTRGIWENVDEGELADVFAEAGNEPAQECDKVEDLLLSRQPANLENYTFAAIYIDKVFTDPNRRKRIKRIVTITVIVLVLALVIGVAVFLWRRDRRLKRESMEQYFSNTETYMEDNNFIRAKQECEKALELAQKLHDREAAERYNAYVVCLEAVIGADDAYSAGDYTEAKDAYLKAKARVRYADNAGLAYIEDRLSRIGAYEQVFDNIELGDRLLERDSYELAEAKYLEAKKGAASIYFDEGKKQALDALDRLYEEWSAVIEEEEQQRKEQEQQNEEEAAELAAQQAAAAELVRQGDETFAQGDYDGANVFYLIAMEKYAALEDTAQMEFLNKKIAAVKEKQAEVEARIQEARTMEEYARMYEEENDYEQAKVIYQHVKGIYTELGKDNKANEIQGYIDILESKQNKQEKEEEEEASRQAQQAADAQEQAEREKEKQEKAAQEQAEREWRARILEAIEREARAIEERERAEREKAEKEKEEQEKEEEKTEESTQPESGTEPDTETSDAAGG